MEDVVKVEVWDVVDKGKKRTPLEGLKLGSPSAGLPCLDETPALDAEFLDVYKATNGVILVMDITKNWSVNFYAYPCIVSMVPYRSQTEISKVHFNVPSV